MLGLAACTTGGDDAAATDDPTPADPVDVGEEPDLDPDQPDTETSEPDGPASDAPDDDGTDEPDAVKATTAFVYNNATKDKAPELLCGRDGLGGAANWRAGTLRHQLGS